ncbi:MAG: DUF4062 domain-containing protein [Pyrinomonadaceae bacterium]
MSQPATRPVAVIGGSAQRMPAYLREALEVCLRLNVVPVTVEHVARDDSDAVERALGLLDEADVYIGIVGDEYGRVIPGYDRSVGELEYERALERGIPRLMFTARRADPEMNPEPDADGGDARLEAFIRRSSERQSIRPAASPKEFRALLLDGLTGLGMSRLTRGSRKAVVRKGVARVFVASPTDVREERSRMPKVVESLNRTLGKMIGVTIELWRWETDAPAAAGEPQPLVNVEMDEADVVLAIFWNRFGTPTSAGVTGTEGEVLRSLERWSTDGRPQVMVYFCQRPALLDRAALEQRLKVLDFRERIGRLIMAVDYSEVEEFEWRVRDDLFTTIARLCLQRP